MEEALIKMTAIHHFAGIKMMSDRIPCVKTFITFRHLLEKH